MTTTTTIYRVICKTTTSLQPDCTHWRTIVLYCGTDHTDAQVAYHGSEPEDSGYSCGNPARRTIFEQLDAACPVTHVDAFSDAED